MTVEVVDGIKVLKLQDDPLRAEPAGSKADDMLTLVRLWQLLTGGDGLRDGSLFARQTL